MSGEEILTGMEAVLTGSDTNTGSFAEVIQQSIKDPSSVMTAQAIIILISFVWILSLIRTIKDIRSRTKNTIAQALSIVCITFLTPIFGLPIYLVFRPTSTHKDRLYRREALDLGTTTCNQCNMINKLEFRHCVSCGNELHHKCINCDRKYSHEYNNCPSCGTSKKGKRTHKKLKKQDTEK